MSRSRCNRWRWLDAVDAPLVEEAERYRLTLTPDTGPARTIEQAASRFVYSAAERAGDRAGGATQLTVSICQLGSFGLSRPTTIPLSLT